MKSVFLLSSAVLLSGCSDPGPKPVRGDSRAKNYPLFSIDMDPQRTMPFDPAQPYHLKFGRGSRTDGLETISIDENGQVVLYRLKEEAGEGATRHSWETTNFSIDAETTRRIAEVIRDCGLPGMNLTYDAKTDEGSRWVFRLTQGDHQKLIYFNNYFPDVIQDFAVALDRELKQAGVDHVEWSPVPAEQAREHDKDLRESDDR